LSFLPFSGSEHAATEPYDAEAALVRAALRRIPRDQAVTLTLALHEGFTRREIGHMLNLTDDGVKSRLSRGRRNFAMAYRQMRSE